MHTRSQMTLHWVNYCANKTKDWNICKAGIGIVNDGDNHEYYSKIGLDALFKAALIEVHGPEDHPAWPCGIIPTRN